MSNRLANETSPYLLQHADNPVEWWPWSAEAFAEARERGVPVLLSVGYSSCHWCHVMAHESFEDELTAAYLNEHFVNVKVDREERPDVDAVYMEAVQAATGQGGWPMTVFLTGDAEPFYFGTYFPPEPRHGMPSFMQVLEGVRTAWVGRPEEVAEVARRIVGDLAGRQLDYGKAGLPGPEELAGALLGLTREYDSVRGGFGGAPKFPPSMVLEFLLRHHARTGSEGALQMAADTCEAMARGGIYDQLGGGFARYSVDREWVVPHFEKMLYDNALLCRVYAHLWRATGSDLARRVALETADFMVRELRTEQGGFASALDADSEEPLSGRHVEGAYYAWTPAQFAEVLGETDGALAQAYFGVTEEGTFEHGKSVLQLPQDGPALDAERLAGIKERLLAARAGRPAPGRDDKVVAAWNGLAIAALAECGAYFGRAGPDRAGHRGRRPPRTGPHGRLRAPRPHQPRWPRRPQRRGAGGLRRCRRGLPRAGLRHRRGGLAGVRGVPRRPGHGPLHRRGRLPVRHRARRGEADPQAAGPHRHGRPLRLDGRRGRAPLVRRAHRLGAPPHGGRTGARGGARPRAARPALHRARPGGGRGARGRAARGGRRGAPGGSGAGRAAPDRVAGDGSRGGGGGRAAARRGRERRGVPLLAERTLVHDLPTAYVCRHFVCARPTTELVELADQLGAVHP